MNLKETNSLYYNPYAFEKSVKDIKLLERKVNNERNEKYLANKKYSMKSVLTDCGNFLNLIFDLKKQNHLSYILNTSSLRSCGILFVTVSICLLFITYLQKS